MKNKLGFTAGILNIVLGGVLFVDVLLFVVMAACCLMMSFSLFFMAAIPAFLVTLFLAAVNFAMAVGNVVTGASAVATARKGGKVSHIVSIASMVVDIIVLPTGIFGLLAGIYLLTDGIDVLSVFIVIVAGLGVLLAIVSLVFQIVCVLRKGGDSTIKNEE